MIELLTYLHAFSLLAASAAHHVSSTPPRIAQNASNHLLDEKSASNSKSSRTSTVDELHGNRLFNCVGMLGVATSKYAVWFIVAIDVVARLLSLCSSHPFAAQILLILMPPKPHLLLTTPGLLYKIGILCISLGFIIRKACFNEMGRLFSFTHTTLSDHKLITSGPYSVVRHPSYTGEVLVRGGTAVLLLDAGGILSQSGALSFQYSFSQSTVILCLRVAAMIYLGWISFGCTFLILRSSLEDETLHDRFGREWEVYSQRVPWRFIPLVI